MEVDIPDVMKVTSKSTFTMSSSSTHQQTSTDTNGHSNTISSGVPAHSSICATITGTTVDYRQTFSVPAYLSGMIRCQYSSRCRGHYYWYANLVSSDFSSNLDGVATSNTVTEVKSSIQQGVCPEGCEKYEALV